jgi:outer membrane receptor for ferrienterochelin and colicins
MSMRSNPVISAVLFWSLAVSGGVYAQADSDEFFNLSLEELSDVDVYSATKTYMPINKSPGVIRSFNRRDFEKFGFKTLKDVMSAVPGVQQVLSYKNHTNLWVRGIQTRYNSKLLLLIDGVPIRENYYGHFDIESGMRLDNVERIEIINGPGSVLYGANAFAGVISVTTRNRGRELSLETAIQKGYGYHGKAPESTGEAAHEKHSSAYLLSAQTDARINESTRLYGFAQVGQGKPFNPERDHERGNPYDHAVHERKQFFMGKLFFDGLTLTASDNMTDIPDIHGKHFKDYQHVHRPQYLALSYNEAFGNDARLNAQIWYENYDYDELKTEYEDDGSGLVKENQEGFIHTRMYGLDLDYTTNPAPGHQLTAGVAWLHDESIDRIREHNDVDGWGVWDYALDRDVARDTVGVFAQDHWKITEAVSLTTGARYDYLSDFDDQLSLRLGITGNLDGGYYGKLLLGSAYRTPNYREYVKSGVENPSIKPERLITTELQLGKAFWEGDVNLTLYYNIYNDFINDLLVPKSGDPAGCLLPDPDTDQYYSNFDRRNISGLEFMGTFYPTDRLTLKMTAGSIFKATETAGELPTDVIEKGGACSPYQSEETDIALLSKYMLSLLASYRFNNGVQGGFNLRYASDRKTPPNYHASLSPLLKTASADHADAYFLLDLFATVKLDDGMTLDLGIDNVLDQRVYHPRTSDVTDYGVEMPGRRFEIKFSYAY